MHRIGRRIYTIDLIVVRIHNAVSSVFAGLVHDDGTGNFASVCAGRCDGNYPSTRGDCGRYRRFCAELLWCGICANLRLCRRWQSDSDDGDDGLNGRAGFSVSRGAIIARSFKAVQAGDLKREQPVPTQNSESQRNPGVSPAFRVLSKDTELVYRSTEPWVIRGMSVNTKSRS